VQVEYVIGKPKSDMEEEEESHQEVGTSTATENKRGKQPIQRSLRKKEEVAITLPCIQEGVTILPNILGCVEKLRYAYHDGTNRDKFHEFEPHVYMERKWISVIGVPILEPKWWITCLYNTGIMNLLEIPHFG